MMFCVFENVTVLIPTSVGLTYGKMLPFWELAPARQIECFTFTWYIINTESSNC